MELAAIEAILMLDPTDRETWAVYADALATLGADGARARAIHEALQGGGPPTDPALLGPVEPGKIEVEWRFGFWLGAWVRAASDPTATKARILEVLRHPSARLLSYLRMAQLGLDAEVAAAMPASLRRLDLLSVGQRKAQLDVLEPILAALEVLVIHPGLSSLSGLRAPGLSRLVLRGAHPGLSEARLPALEILELEAPDLRELARLHPQAAPQLRTLRLGSRRTPPGQLLELLRSPLGQQLRHLEVEGSAALDELSREPRAWAHLERVVVDLPHLSRERPATGRMRLRRSSFSLRHYLRLAPGASRLTLARVLERAAIELGVRAPGVRLGDWLLLPDGLALPLARRVALLADHPARLLQVDISEIEEGGRVTTLFLDRSLLEIHPDGKIEGIEDEMTREDISYSASDSESDLRHADDREWLYEELWHGLEVCTESMSVPVGWGPDPFLLARSPSCLPQGLEGPGGRIELDRALATYLIWRSEALGVLEPAEAPQLGRWTRRLLRRHGLESAPDPDHPYWADWAELTSTERAQRATGPGRIPSFKLTVPGRWVLVPQEREVLCDALQQPIPHHERAAELTPVLSRLIGFLGEDGLIEVIVTG